MITPKVFISYSHDTPEHKMWVMKLAQKLMDNGIEVMLDMWELGPGDDIARFMERGLMEADRILMVCTESTCKGRGGTGRCRLREDDRDCWLHEAGRLKEGYPDHSPERY